MPTWWNKWCSSAKRLICSRSKRKGLVHVCCRWATLICRPLNSARDWRTDNFLSFFTKSWNWMHRGWNTGYQLTRVSKGRPRDLALKDQLFMVLFRLRTGTCGKETARNFGVSESTISRTFCTWINFLELAAMTFPTLEQVQQHMPESVHFSQRVLDCIEVRIQKPSGLNTRKQIFSIYKHYNTFKVLVGATPDGYLCFLSELWEAMLVIQKLSREVVW